MNAWGIIPRHCNKTEEEKIHLYCSIFISSVKYLYFVGLKWKAKRDQRAEKLNIMGADAWFLQAGSRLQFKGLHEATEKAQGQFTGVCII